MSEALDAAWAEAEAALPPMAGGINVSGLSSLDFTASVRIGRTHGSAGFRGHIVGVTAATPTAESIDGGRVTLQDALTWLTSIPAADLANLRLGGITALAFVLAVCLGVAAVWRWRG